MYNGTQIGFLLSPNRSGQRNKGIVYTPSELWSLDSLEGWYSMYEIDDAG
jgi:hypothetical protein